MKAVLKRARDENGSFYLEVMVGTMIFFFVMTALLGLFAAGAQLLAAGRSEAGSLQFANQLLEEIRATEYDDIGLIDAAGDEPPGVFQRSQPAIAYRGVAHDVQRAITWVDDPADGLGAADMTGDGTHDYKRIMVSVRRTATGGAPAKPWVKLASDVKLMTLTTIKPTVEFKSPSPDAGSVTLVGGPRSSYGDESLTGSLAIPLVVDANDDPLSTGGLTTAGFYVNGAILDVVSGALAGKKASIILNPPLMYWSDDGSQPAIPSNDIVYWNPFTLDSLTEERVYPDGEYHIMVQVWNAGGGRDARTINYILDKEPPEWPEGSYVNAQQWNDPFTIRLTWSAAVDGIQNISEYELYRDGAYWKTVNSTGLVAYDTGLAQWSTHSYEVVAVSPGGRESAALGGASATATTMINVNSSVVKNKGKNNVVLSWNRPVSETISNYRIYRTGWATPLTLVNNNTTVTWTDTNVANGTYTYRVVATYPDGHTNTSPNIIVVVN
ncbi:MAG: fibronectin type III domain-containing protein [Candidatus Aquicultorales bacterium]